MKLRCGRCRATFEPAAGATTMPCPVCGTPNRVPGTAPTPPVASQAPPVPAHARADCPECGHRFVVGAVEVAVCPNCRTEVSVS